MLSKELLDMLCCPVCRGDLIYMKESSELLCRGCKRAYPVRDDIPIMLAEEAKIREDVKLS